jgi:hypothetical protein
MAAIFIHETVHSLFHKLIYDQSAGETLSIQDFSFSSDLWEQAVIAKYGSAAITNHHALMNEYLVPQIAEDLWRLNGETDPSKIEDYKYLVYDLLATDDQLVSLGFMTQQELIDYKNNASSLISNIGYE